MTGAGKGGGGIRTYAVELLGGLRRAIGHDAVTEFACPQHFSRDRRILRAVDTLHHQSLWLGHTLPRQIRAAGIDLFHNPGAHIPQSCSTPLVVTLHDLYAFRNPAAFRSWHRMSSQFFHRRSVREADRIIAISEFTRQEIHDVFGPAYEDKIVVIHEAAHPRFSPVTPEQGQAVMARHQLESPYVLCVSTVEPRKNFVGILEAFSRIRDRVEHDLVIVGGKGWKQEHLQQRIAALGLTERVRFLGYVDLDDLPALYTRADLFAYPSFYEGFGLPILEAMGCGCPVLTSDAASMPEVAGGAAVLANPAQVEDIAEKLEVTLLSESRRAELSQAGCIRAAEFSWDRCARETMAVYHSLG